MVYGSSVEFLKAMGNFVVFLHPFYEKLFSNFILQKNEIS